jgi:hypothetical protein
MRCACIKDKVGMRVERATNGMGMPFACRLQSVPRNVASERQNPLRMLFIRVTLFGLRHDRVINLSVDF